MMKNRPLPTANCFWRNRSGRHSADAGETMNTRSALSRRLSKAAADLATGPLEARERVP
jgi:hypothetical protein